MGLSSGNLLSCLPQAPSTDETVETLFERPGFRIERIVSTGQVTRGGQWYDQETDEWVLVVEGSARLRIESETADRELGPGDFVFLPAHCRHRVTWTEPGKPTVWLAIHYASLDQSSS